MTPQTHLFLAAPAAAFGEVTTGLRMARDLMAEGDRVVFAAGADVAVLFQGTEITYLPVDGEVFGLERFVTRLVQRERCTTVTLVDVTSLFLALDPVGIDLGFLDRLSVPVLALDFWNLRRAGPEWDFGKESLPIPGPALRFERRLLPVPIARPDAGKGAFAALPEPLAVLPTERRAAREELGLADGDRLVFWASSRWQRAEAQTWKHHARVARQVPEWIACLLDRLGPRVHVLHLGPQSLPAFAGWHRRYHWRAQVAPERLRGLMGAADLLLSLNLTATTNFAAISMGLPIVVVVNSHRGSAEDLARALPVSDAQRAWLAEAAPLHRFRLWPLGLYDFLGPVLEDNPYTDAFRTVELLDEPTLERTLRTLLFDEPARESDRARQAVYRDRVRGLPGPAAAFRAWL